MQFLESYDPIFVNIQEINTQSAIKVFSRNYQVIINLEMEAKDGIGIVTLIKKGIQISDLIIGKNSKIIGVKVKNIQLWNVCPKSGSSLKTKERSFLERNCVLL